MSKRQEPDCVCVASPPRVGDARLRRESHANACANDVFRTQRADDTAALAAQTSAIQARKRSRVPGVGAAVAVFAALGALAAGAALATRDAPAQVVAASAEATLPAHPWLERDGIRYEYDALRDNERVLLVDPASGSLVDVSAERPADLARLRALLLRELGVSSLATLRDAHAPAAAALRRLGYL